MSIVYHYIINLSILLFLCQSENSLQQISNQFNATTNAGSRWFFLSYHKTGFELSKKIVSILPHQFHVAPLLPNRSHFIYSSISPIYRAIRFYQPDLHADWPSHSPDGMIEYRYIHHVRDPYDMVISAYLYHGQEPPPPFELWQVVPVKTSTNFCSTPISLGVKVIQLYTIFRNVMTKFSKDAEKVDRMLSRLKASCFELTAEIDRRLPSSFRPNYSTVLSVAKSIDNDEFNGIRMQAFFSIISNGDIVRMAVNALSSDPKRTLHLYMTEFPSGNESAYQSTIRKMYNFLVNDVDEKG